MSRRRSAVLVAALAAGLAVWWWWGTHPTPPLADGAAPGAAAKPTPGGVRVPKPTAPTSRPSARAASTQGPTASPSSSAPAAPAPSPAADEEENAGGPVDRRRSPPADADAVRELLKQTMEEATVAVTPCVERLVAEQPQLKGRLLLRAQLDQDGLTDVFMEELTSVPPALLTCFGDALYAVDWAGISREPIELSWPVEVDAGE